MFGKSATCQPVTIASFLLDGPFVTALGSARVIGTRELCQPLLYGMELETLNLIRPVIVRTVVSISVVHSIYTAHWIRRER